MHKCGVGRVVTCSWWWLHSFPAFSFYEHFMLASSREVILVKSLKEFCSVENKDFQV